MEGLASADDTAVPALVPDESLPRLYREHRLALVRLAVLLLGEQSPAEDVVQDVFAGMWRRQVLPSAASGYLRRAVVNRCRSHVRRTMLARRTAQLRDPATAGPGEVAEFAEEHREVLAALDSLPRRQREVLVLRYFGDLSVADVASTLGIHEGTVKSQAARGLDKLRVLLNEESA